MNRFSHLCEICCCLVMMEVFYSFQFAAEARIKGDHFSSARRPDEACWKHAAGAQKISWSLVPNQKSPLQELAYKMENQATEPSGACSIFKSLQVEGCVGWQMIRLVVYLNAVILSFIGFRIAPVQNNVLFLSRFELIFEMWLKSCVSSSQGL